MKTRSRNSSLYGLGIFNSIPLLFNLPSYHKIYLGKPYLSWLYQERDEKKRKEFTAKIAKIKEENLVFIDESGVDDNEFYAYGWAPKGERLFAEKPAFKKKRISIIGALNEGKVGAP